MWVWRAAEVSQVIVDSAFLFVWNSVYFCDHLTCRNLISAFNLYFISPPDTAVFLSSLTSVKSDKDIHVSSLHSISHCSVSTSDSFSLIYSVTPSLGWFLVIVVVYHHTFCCQSRASNDNISSSKSWLYKTLVAHTYSDFLSYALPSFSNMIYVAITLWKTSLLALDFCNSQLNCCCCPTQFPMTSRGKWMDRKPN